ERRAHGGEVREVAVHRLAPDQRERGARGEVHAFDDRVARDDRVRAAVGDDRGVVADAERAAPARRGERARETFGEGSFTEHGTAPRASVRTRPARARAPPTAGTAGPAGRRTASAGSRAPAGCG